jgi:transcriptional regulator with XRE-family HTH domain
MNILKNRIKHIAEQSGLSYEAFGKKLGVSKQAVSNWISGDIKDLRMERLFKIEDEFGYSARWLATGKGPMQAGQIEDRHSKYSPATIAICNLIEKLDSAGKRSIQESVEKALLLQELEKELSEYKQKFDVPPLLASFPHLHGHGAFF